MLFHLDSLDRRAVAAPIAQGSTHIAHRIAAGRHEGVGCKILCIIPFVPVAIGRFVHRAELDGHDITLQEAGLVVTEVGNTHAGVDQNVSRIGQHRAVEESHKGRIELPGIGKDAVAVVYAMMEGCIGIEETILELGIIVYHEQRPIQDNATSRRKYVYLSPEVRVPIAGSTCTYRRKYVYLFGTWRDASVGGAAN